MITQKFLAPMSCVGEQLHGKKRLPDRPIFYVDAQCICKLSYIKKTSEAVYVFTRGSRNLVAAQYGSRMVVRRQVACTVGFISARKSFEC